MVNEFGMLTREQDDKPSEPYDVFEAAGRSWCMSEDSAATNDREEEMRSCRMVEDAARDSTAQTNTPLGVNQCSWCGYEGHTRKCKNKYLTLMSIEFYEF